MKTKGEANDNLRILLVIGSQCTREEHIIKNYDDISGTLFLQKLFLDLDDIPEEHIFYSFTNDNHHLMNYTTMRNFHTPSHHYHVDFSGKQYSFPITDLRIDDSYFAKQIKNILKHDSSGIIKEQDPIDLIVYFKDHGNKYYFGDMGLSYAELLINLETEVPSEYRNRTCIFIDSCYSGSILFTYEYWKAFSSLFSESLTSDEEAFILGFLSKCIDKIKNLDKDNEDISQIPNSKIIPIIEKTAQNYMRYSKHKVLSNLNKDGIADFLKKFVDYILEQHSPLLLKSFFSKPLWLFFSSTEDIPTFTYPFRKIQRDHVYSVESNDEDELSIEDLSNELVISNIAPTPDIDAKLIDSYNSTFNHNKDDDQDFDITKLSINVREKDVYFIQPSSYFTNAVISALFPQQMKETMGHSEYGVKTFQQIITNNMNAQRISFYESQIYKSAIHNLTQLQTEYTSLLEECNKYNIDDLDSDIKSKESELTQLKNNRKTFVSTYLSDDDVLSDSPNSQSEIPPDIIIHKFKELIKKIGVLKTQITKSKEELIKAKKLIQHRDKLKSCITDIENDIKEVNSFFNEWKENAHLHFKEFNTENSQFIDFSQLQKKPFCTIPYQNIVSFNDYTYFDHTYAPLFKATAISDKPDIPESKYMKWQKGFNSDYRKAIDARLKQFNFPAMQLFYPQDSFSKESSQFYDSFVFSVKYKFGGRYAVYVGGVMRDIRGYYDEIKPPIGSPLIKILILAVEDVDRRWREEYFQSLEAKRQSKQKHIQNK